MIVPGRVEVSLSKPLDTLDDLLIGKPKRFGEHLPKPLWDEFEKLLARLT